MSGLASIYYSGWSAQKHVVFFAHGKYGQWWSMYNTFCTPDVVVLTCPAFEQPLFKNLVFTFGGSGLSDTGTGPYSGAIGWSADADDASSFATAANELSTNLISKIKYGETGAAIGTFGCKYSCTRYCSYTKGYSIGDNTKRRQLMRDFMPNAMYAQPRGAEKAKGFDDDGGDPGERKAQQYAPPQCYWTCKLTCPFNHRTELMIVGYSDGGGLGTYMNYHSDMVTKAVSIDYWAYAAYETWLGQLSSGGMVNNQIYTACASGIFDDGPSAILEDSSPVGYTYVTGAGLSYDGYGTSFTKGGVDWIPLSWSSGSKYIGMNIHGLASIPAIPPADSEDSQWDSECTANALSGDAHHSILGTIPAEEEVDEWLGAETSRRRQLKTVKQYEKNADAEAYIASKPYDKATFGSYARTTKAIPATTKAKLASVFNKVKAPEKEAMLKSKANSFGGRRS